MKSKKKIAVLTGAGISAESGIKTFRDANGLWEGHDIMEVASPQGWHKNKALVLEFYNKRRKQLHEVKPNAAHFALKNLEEQYEVVIITQNVDDLHERAGSSIIIHLHGELKKMRSVLNSNKIYDIEKDINIGDLAKDGGQLRPHIVWFGEPVPMIEKAASEIYNADIVIIIGTSMQVYPAAGLIEYTSADCDIFYIDPKPHISYELSKLRNLNTIEKTATTGVPQLVNTLLTN